MKSFTFHNPSELTCSICHRALEETVVEEDGELRTYLQCWHCFTSFPAYSMRIPVHSLPAGNTAFAPILPYVKTVN